jgi:hypothetical protein
MLHDAMSMAGMSTTPFCTHYPTSWPDVLGAERAFLYWVKTVLSGINNAMP